ncbi:MAG: hypothetical protein K6G55_06560 [Selenomonadaceae bacterium]|nr:hypothetical protein [Selenomonadaceae bacterium]
MEAITKPITAIPVTEENLAEENDKRLHEAIDLFLRKCRENREFFYQIRAFAYGTEYENLLCSKSAFDEKKIFDYIKAGKKIPFIDISGINVDSAVGENKNNDYIKDLLEVDTKRVGLDAYDENLLYDPNRGHWDLWNLQTSGKSQLKLKKPIYARNPIADINPSGIVGIDFGTKSTVVAFENEHGKIIPLQVGKGDYSKGLSLENYENPTVMQFINIEKFLADYKARRGRPETSLEDITVSHNAQTNLKNTRDTSLYASFFENLKQWCGDLQFITKIRDNQGTEKDLMSFITITDDEFNPLEIYAYYLGAYINHMLQPKHIFMKYILSFPVMYERNIREKMLQCFRRGLMKSLPESLLADENAMKKFQVIEGTSEPAAYAVTGLEGYGFINNEWSKEEETDGIYYSVFDFGGGTTDFDFGVLKYADDDDADFYDYILMHFGSHGDRTLGGENLLRLMAFEVFKANRDKLLNPRKNSKHSSAKIPFTWAADRRDFVGSEGLVRPSQEANLNMYNLMNALRPIWEAPDSDDSKKTLDSGKISITVFDDVGEEITDFSLDIGVQNFSYPQNDQQKNDSANETPSVDLEKILRDRICHGVDSFFISMREAFDKVSGGEDNGVALLSEIKEIKIFLAGNSTKSALVKKIFEEYTDYENGKARELLGFGRSQKMPKFVLYPPLGTEEAYEIQTEKGITVDKNDFERPTGKTGVAFGLLRCREGSLIKVVDITPEGIDMEQVPFQFYVGRARRGKFTVIIDKSAKLGKWKKFIGAKFGVFDLLYTTDSVAATDNAPVSIAKRLTISVEANESANVYVKAVESNKIAYTVSEDLPEPNVEGIVLTLE